MSLSKLKIGLEHEDIEKIKATVFILAVLNISLFLAATFFLVKGLFTLSYILSLGVIAYLLALFYEIERVERRLLEELEGKVKSFFEVLIRVVTGGVFTLMVFLLLLYFINLPLYNFSFYDRVLSLFAIPILVFPVIFWSRIVDFFKGKLGRGLVLVSLVFLLSLPTFAQNRTNETEEGGGLSEDLGKISKTISLIQKGLKAFNKIIEFLKEQRGNLQSMFGLSKGQSTVFLGLILLISIFIALKIIRTLIKWAIIILVIWLVLQVMGVVGKLPTEIIKSFVP